MTPEPAQPAESPEARALPQPSAAATAIALTAKPGDFPTDSYSLAMWLDRALLAATTARPTERGAVDDYEKAYFERGMFAAYAWMITKRRDERLSDAVVDYAWEHRDEGMGPTECLPKRPFAALTPPVTVAATDQAAEVECREALSALVTAAAEYQEAAQQHISDTRYDEDGNLAARDAELSVVALPRAREALATQPATGRTMGGEVEAAVLTLDVFLAAYDSEPDDAIVNADDDLLTWGHLRTILAALQNGGE